MSKLEEIAEEILKGVLTRVVEESTGYAWFFQPLGHPKMKPNTQLWRGAANTIYKTIEDAVEGRPQDCVLWEVLHYQDADQIMLVRLIRVERG